jgi:hypothetical protein
MRYGVFSGYVDYPADTRNSNDSNGLWLIFGSDYPADTRKLNVYSGLRRNLILAPEAIAARAPRQLPASARSRSDGPPGRDLSAVFEGVVEIIRKIHGQ